MNNDTNNIPIHDPFGKKKELKASANRRFRIAVRIESTGRPILHF